MYGHRKAEIVVSFIKVIKVIFPKVLNDAGMHPAVRIGHVLDEHLGEARVSIVMRPLMRTQQANLPSVEDRQGTN